MSELFTFEGFKIEDDLQHYGIKGMQWGIRRFQNPDGSLTPEGRKRYGHLSLSDAKKAIKEDVKKDNEKAFEIGKKATMASKSADILESRYKNSLKAYENAIKKDPKGLKSSTQKIISEQYKDRKIYEIAKEIAEIELKNARIHFNELVDKYGKESIENIVYDKNGKINENISSGKEKFGYVLLGSTGLENPDMTYVREFIKLIENEKVG